MEKEYIYIKMVRFTKGDWKNDKQDGVGKEKWMDGARYEGEYKNGERNGKGKEYH